MVIIGRPSISVFICVKNVRLILRECISQILSAKVGCYTNSIKKDTKSIQFEKGFVMVSLYEIMSFFTLSRKRKKKKF